MTTIDDCLKIIWGSSEECFDLIDRDNPPQSSQEILDSLGIKPVENLESNRTTEVVEPPIRSVFIPEEVEAKEEKKQTTQQESLKKKTEESKKEEKSKIYIPNFAYPFKRISNHDKTKSTYDLMMENLFKDKETQYLFNASGLFHGGVHLNGMKFCQTTFDTDSIRAIADGRVIAYRIDKEPLENELNDETVRYTTGFFLLEHKMEYPVGNKLTFYSLYMHMASMDMYEFEEEFKTTTKGSKAYLQKEFNRERVKPEELISEGTEITIGTEIKNNRYQVLHDGTKKREDVVSIYKKDITKTPKSDNKKNNGIITRQMKTDQVVELEGEEQIEVKAGEVLGKLGLYSQEWIEEPVVHLEVFTFDDVEKFQCDATKEYEEEIEHEVGGTDKTPIVKGWRNTGLVPLDDKTTDIQYIAKGTPIKVKSEKKSVSGYIKQQVIEVDGSNELVKDGEWTIAMKQVVVKDEQKEKPKPNILYVPKETTELFEKGYDDTIYAKVTNNTNIRKGTTNEGEIYKGASTKKGTELVLGTTTHETKETETKSYYRQSVLEIAGEKVEGYTIHTNFFKVIEKDIFVPKETDKKLQSPVIKPIKNLKIEKDKEGIEYIQVATNPKLYVKKYQDKEQVSQWFTHGVTLKMFEVMKQEGNDNIGIFDDTVSFYDGRESNTKKQDEKEKLNPLFQEILLQLKLGEDKDSSGTLEAGELAGLTLTQAKQKELSYIVAKHESEWENPTRFEALATFLDEVKATEHAKMLRDRTKNLSFFDDVMALDFFPTFFHPIALVGAMVRECKEREEVKLFNFEDAKAGIKYIYDVYGREMAIIIEKLYRDETGHFSSEQYMRCGAGGMEVNGKKPPPYYGWDAKLFDKPPMGLWKSKENIGKSEVGGNKQEKFKKSFIILESVSEAMVLKARYIIKYKGNYARWHAGDDEVAAAAYKKGLKKIRYDIVKAIEEGTLSTLKNLPHKVKVYKKNYLKIVKELKLELEDECEEIEKIEELSGDWHDPIDNPMLCLYNYVGTLRPVSNTFGWVRKKRDGSKRRHQGVDLFAVPGTPVYACMDGTIVRKEYAGSYGNVLTLKVEKPHKMKSRKQEFTLIYKDEMKQGPKFDDNGDFYIFYAHLSKWDVNLNDEVKCGQKIGEVGTSGFGTTRAPHLHFEILNARSAGNFNNRVHPKYYCYYKQVADMTDIEKQKQEEASKKDWN